MNAFFTKQIRDVLTMLVSDNAKLALLTSKMSYVLTKPIEFYRLVLTGTINRTI